MIVNYNGIAGCDYVQDRDGAYLTAPAAYRAELLTEKGFSLASDGTWIRRLTGEEAAYVYRNRYAVTVTLQGSEPQAAPEPVQSGKKDLGTVHYAVMLNFIGVFLGFILPLYGMSPGEWFPLYCWGGCYAASMIILIRDAVRHPENKKLTAAVPLFCLLGVLVFLLVSSGSTMCMTCSDEFRLCKFGI